MINKRWFCRKSSSSAAVLLQIGGGGGRLIFINAWYAVFSSSEIYCFLRITTCMYDYEPTPSPPNSGFLHELINPQTSFTWEDCCTSTHCSCVFTYFKNHRWNILCIFNNSCRVWCIDKIRRLLIAIGHSHQHCGYGFTRRETTWHKHNSVDINTTLTQ